MGFRSSIIAYIFSACILSSQSASAGPFRNLVEKLRAQGEKEGWTFRIQEHPIFETGLAAMTGLKRPENYQTLAPYRAVYTVATLPERWDWREQNGVTEVRSQGGCGSCWAFGTVAVMESAIKIKTGKEVNLSEQQLISCQPDYGSCWGGYFALGFYKKQGANREEDFAYQGRNALCKTSAPQHEKITSWAYVGQSGRSPTTEELKAAIHDYGPVAVTVTASNAFMGYSGGTFNACSSRSTNHIVAIVGWDDREQVWIVKNSWGKGWGEKGFMRIRYTDALGRKCSRIGEDAVMLTSMPGE